MVECVKDAVCRERHNSEKTMAAEDILVMCVCLQVESDGEGGDTCLGWESEYNNRKLTVVEDLSTKIGMNCEKR